MLINPLQQLWQYFTTDTLNHLKACFQATTDNSYSLAERSCALILCGVFGLLFSSAGFAPIGILLICLPFIYIVPLLRYFPIVANDNCQWIITYIFFCICGVWWMWSLAEWQGGAVTSNMGIILFNLSHIIILFLAILFTKSAISKWITWSIIGVCVILSYYISELGLMLKPYIKLF